MAPPISRAALLKLYARHLSVSGKSALSVAKYCSNLEFFLDSCKHDPAEISIDHINEYLEDARRQRSAATLNQIKSSIRGFFRYLFETDRIEKDPARLLRNEKIIRRDPPVFSQEQLAALFGTMKAAIGHPAYYQAARDFALYNLGYHAGLRAGVELLALNIQDVEDKDWLTVIGKRGRRRTIPLNTTARKAISDYLPVRRDFKGVDGNALFLNRFGTRLGITAVEKNLKTWLQRANIQGDFWPHLLRHTCATVMQGRRGDLRLTQAFLGHSSPTTTAIYAHTTPSGLQEAAESLTCSVARRGEIL